MPTTVNLRKLLDRKQWEFCSVCPVILDTGTSCTPSVHFDQNVLMMQTNNVAYLYDPFEDGYTALPSAGLTGSASSGISAAAVAVGPTGTATGGSTTTIATTLNLQQSLTGYKVHITAGPGAGETKTILFNTLGANATITVDSAFGAAITSSSVFRLLTPRWYVLVGGAPSAGSFRYYDYATNTWVTVSQTGLPTSANQSQLLSTPSFSLTDYQSFATGTATAGGASTITNSAKTWTTNQWTNYQIRIVSGTGAGQIRTIASNTGTVITVSSAWTTNPDATSVYSIEGNDDFLYFLYPGNVGLYRYSISANTWTLLSPTVARGGAPTSMTPAFWANAVSSPQWTNESAIINGERIYSFRGSATLDYYDIAQNTWVNAVPHTPGTVGVTIFSRVRYSGDYVYIATGTTSQWTKLDLAKSKASGWNSALYPASSSAFNDTAFNITYVDGTTKLTYIYYLVFGSGVLLRQLDI
jgi:hypothetical protein